ncbi:hypothetical protein [Nocardia sp. NPDC049707]|uniref:helix-turn-helix domain-containing protein n=1 Tax=Nocardia sp. NPDC049707 TaxID=3154735 RepID=UPI0034192A78
MTATEPLRFMNGLVRAGVDSMIVTSWTGREVKVMRLAVLRVTQKELAEILGFTEAVVRKWEGRKESITLSGQYAAAMDTVLERLDQAQLARFEAALSGSGSVSAQLTVSTAGRSTDFDSPAVIAQRVQRLTEVDADDEVLDILSLAVDDILDRYELEGPRRLAPEAVSARAHVETILQQRRHPDQLRRLYQIAGQLSGVLAYMAVNRGRFGHAKMYCREAFATAARVDDIDLQAWVKGTESFCAYYQGDFAAAVRLAYEGLDLSSRGPQSIRLYSNGLARAMGKLGDAHGVTSAIEQANEIAAALDTGPGLTPALTFAPYGEARLLANAATACLSGGQYQRALEYGYQVEDRVNAADSVWSHSLVRLDVAAALLRQPNRDVEQAAQLGVEALAQSTDRPIRSVWQRAHDLGELMETVPSSGSAGYLDELHEWAPAAREFAAPEDR